MMENLMIKSIEEIYKTGVLTICYKDSTYKLIGDKQANFVIEYVDKETGNKIRTSNKESLASMLVSFFRYTVMSGESNIELSSDNGALDITTKIRIVNKLYSFYIKLLRDKDTVKDIIIRKNEGEKDSEIFKDIIKDACSSKSFKPKAYSIDDIIGKLIKGTTEWLTLYKFGTEKYEELSYCYTSNSSDYESVKISWENLWTDSFNIKDVPDEYTDKSTVKKEKEIKKPKTDNKKQQLDTVSLKKNHITYEILNERDFVVDPAIGRDTEIRDAGATLLTGSLSPIILGESGVGKTAIIEGLAYRIKNGLVPDALKNKYILKISPSAMVSGCIYRGQFEEKMQELIKYITTHPDVILYIDEVHTAYKTGSSEGSNNDMLNILKPYLENGSIKMICATTLGEYEEYLKNDNAFTRRLKPVIVNEPSNEILRDIIKSVIIKNEERSGLSFSSNVDIDYIIDILIKVTDKKHRTYKEMRYNPGLLISIIEEAYGYAQYDGMEEMDLKYIVNSLNKCENIYKTGREEASVKLQSLGNKKENSNCKVLEFKPVKRG